MSATATLSPIGPQPVDTTQNQIIADYTITFAGTYSAGSVNGDTLNLADGRVPTGQAPSRVEIYDEPAAGTAPTGYHFVYAKGSNATNGKIVVMVGATGVDTQLTQNATYATNAAALVATPAPVIKARAFFPSY